MLFKLSSKHVTVVYPKNTGIIVIKLSRSCSLLTICICLNWICTALFVHSLFVLNKPLKPVKSSDYRPSAGYRREVQTNKLIHPPADINFISRFALCFIIPAVFSVFFCSFRDVLKLCTRIFYSKLYVDEMVMLFVNAFLLLYKALQQ